jgi:hypothetical protein
MAQLVARLHGMEEVWGSNPHSSTGFPELDLVIKRLTKCLRRSGLSR